LDQSGYELAFSKSNLLLSLSHNQRTYAFAIIKDKKLIYMNITDIN